jgi:hypothetical protein
MRGAIPPLPIRLQGVWCSVKKHRDNFTLYITSTIKTCGGVEVWLHVFLTAVLNRDEVTLTFQSLYLRGIRVCVGPTAGLDLGR